ncbi:MAG TPA: hypothetical protein VF841_16960 [Anaeromyxobacter sp.]
MSAIRSYAPRGPRPGSPAEWRLVGVSGGTPPAHMPARAACAARCASTSAGSGGRPTANTIAWPARTSASAASGHSTRSRP